jgi:hypothetical protein
MASVVPAHVTQEAERAIWQAAQGVEGLAWVLDCPRAARSLAG